MVLVLHMVSKCSRCLKLFYFAFAGQKGILFWCVAIGYRCYFLGSDLIILVLMFEVRISRSYGVLFLGIG